MTVRFHLLDAFDEIPPADRISILASLEQALPLVLARLPIERVDIVVGYSDPAWTIPAWGIGGYAHGKGGSALRLILIIHDLAMPSAVRDWRPSSPTRCTTWRARGDRVSAKRWGKSS